MTAFPSAIRIVGAFAIVSCNAPAEPRPAPEHHIVVSQQVPIAYDVTGRGPVVVLVHGLTLDRQMWDPNLEALASRFRVVRVDFPGAGRSGQPVGPISFSQVVGDVLRDAGIKKAHIVGLSNGGEVAVNFAVEYPASVSSLVLVDASLSGFPYSREFLARFQGYMAAAQQRSVQEANRLWLDDPLFLSARRDSLLRDRLAAIVSPYRGEAWLHFAWRLTPTPAAMTRLELIRAPALVIVGELDVPDMRRIADTLAARIPNAKEVVLAGVGHMSNMESPEAFNRVVIGFLSGTK